MTYKANAKAAEIMSVSGSENAQQKWVELELGRKEINVSATHRVNNCKLSTMARINGTKWTEWKMLLNNF